MKVTLRNSAYPLLTVFVIAFCCLSISGGPIYQTGLNVSGTYGGVLTPACLACVKQDEVIPVKCGNFEKYLEKHPEVFNCSGKQECASNSQGVFSLTAPSTGDATGNFTMFSQGRVFSGTIDGSADAGRSTIAAVLTASYNFTVTEATPCPNVSPEPSPACTPSPSSVSVTAQANGQLKAKIALANSNSSVRLNGRAHLDISQGHVDNDFNPIVTCSMELIVTGFKQ